MLFIGVRDNGEIETPQRNLDKAEKAFNTKMKTVYPRIPCFTKVINENGLQALAVIIPGSDSKPHFAGLSYVRKGSESVEASEEEFTELIALRNDKPREILKWKNKLVTVHELNVEHTMHSLGRIASTRQVSVEDCNPFYLTLRENYGLKSYSLRNIDISFDDSESRLALEKNLNLSVAI